MVLLKTTYTCLHYPFAPSDMRAEVYTYIVVDNNDCGGIWEVVGVNCYGCGNESHPDGLVEIDDEGYCADCAENMGVTI